MSKHFTKGLWVSMAMAAGALAAHAQSYPAGPVTMIVPTSPGTSSDIVARALSQRLVAKWNQPVVVDNKVGASGTIGMGAVARAPADGQTILVVTNTISMISPVQKDRGWSTHDLKPVALMGTTVTALIVDPALPVKSVQDLIALAKSQPGKLNYASPGVRTPHHLYTELFKQISGTDIVHVAYKSTAGAVTDMAGGRVQLGFFPLNAVMPLVKGNKIRVLATAGEQRSPTTPDVPTFSESNIEGVQAGSWIGIFVPKNTPAGIVDKLSADITAILKTQDFQQDLLRQEVIPNYRPEGPGQLAALLQSDSARWQTVIEKAKIVD